MKMTLGKAIAAFVVCAFSTSCANQPTYVLLSPTNVPPENYANFSCEALEAEMLRISDLTETLWETGYRGRTTGQRIADGLGGFGAGVRGDGQEYLQGVRRNGEYDVLQGEYNAIRHSALSKDCPIYVPSPQDILNDYVFEE